MPTQPAFSRTYPSSTSTADPGYRPYPLRTSKLSELCQMKMSGPLWKKYPHTLSLQGWHVNPFLATSGHQDTRPQCSYSTNSMLVNYRVQQ